MLTSKSSSNSKTSKSAKESGIFNFRGKISKKHGLVVFNRGADNREILFFSPQEIYGISHILGLMERALCHTEASLSRVRDKFLHQQKLARGAIK